MNTIKIRANRQVSIPKRVYDELGLKTGDFVEWGIHGEVLVLKPKRLIDADILAGIEDIQAGRFIGPFRTAYEATRALRHKAK